jgi:hypothetical protein
LLVLHTEFFSNLNQATETVDIVRALFINVLINFERFVKKVHASVARSNHKRPLHLLWLYLLGTFKVNNGFFKHIILGVMHTKT